ncbi:MAG: hypothetical protein JOY84_16650 [Curvibacter sp.]|nr:hypothetical protein [Curvibacter sp.]
MIRPESLKGCAGSLSVALLLMLAVVGRAGASPADEVLQGRMLYESRCGGCHAVDANRVGPMHRNLIGRRAGSVPDFAYSPAVRSSSVVWSAQTLEPVQCLARAALERNRDEWVARMRRMGPCPCKQSGHPIARFRSNPKGSGLFGRSAALRHLSIAALSTAHRALHPIPKRPLRDPWETLNRL